MLAGPHRSAHRRTPAGRPARRSTRPTPGDRTVPQPGHRAARHARADGRAAFHSRPEPPRPAARTTGCSPAANPLDGSPVQPHPEPVGDLLAQLAGAARAVADEAHDLRTQLDRPTSATRLVEQPGHPRPVSYTHLRAHETGRNL